MMLRMRTTIRIDDELHRRIKRVADETGRTIGEVIADAVQRSLHDRPAQESLGALPTTGGDGVLPSVDLASNRGLRDLMDDDVAADALR